VIIHRPREITGNSLNNHLDNTEQKIPIIRLVWTNIPVIIKKCGIIDIANRPGAPLTLAVGAL
jgi:hypothetical protein